MAKAKLVKLEGQVNREGPVSAVARRRRTAAQPALAAGLHLGRIEMRAGASFSVRTMAGEVVTAELAHGVEEAFAEECLREARPVVLSADRGGKVLLCGALQTSRSVSRDGEDGVRIEGTRVEIQATQGATIKVGRSAVKLDRQGAVKIVGNRMSIDIAELVRILSARCELP
ncbi:hypothetical protein [Polyangium aurulentum]|uniref:hypothetical protein n=1 Tax=Polyangium aurulentum TaxID=2567896 RepID=UPI0010AE26F1|nr:hypothetical protein [Polyangium aurulentum]UQA63178.1 hypothetical protein E8A73_023020 [Polyangium aurulentum]